MCNNNPNLFSVLDDLEKENSKYDDEIVLEVEFDYEDVENVDGDIEDIKTDLIAARMGWVCPVCFRVHNPNVSSCPCQD